MKKEDRGFLGLLKSIKPDELDESLYPGKSPEPVVDVSEARKGEPEEILRKKGYKIKLVNPTAFGTQIDFAKKYDDEELEKDLKDFNVKIKDKSVFIIE